MVLPIDAMYNLASDALEVIAVRWDAGAEPLPTRRHVTYGVIPVDCEQLVVSAERTFGVDALDVLAEGLSGLGGLSAAAPFATRAITFACAVHRCVPVPDDSGTPPSSAALDAAARTAISDGQAMLNALILGHRAGDLEIGSNGLAFEGGEALTPEGGYGGWLTRVRAFVI